jgi:hypothetical protein
MMMAHTDAMKSDTGSRNVHLYPSISVSENMTDLVEIILVHKIPVIT